MANCGHSCSGCPGCGRELVLTPKEIELLQILGQIPFLPIARTAADPTPVYPGAGEEMSLVLQCLEKKGLISLDFDKPLAGASEDSWGAYPIRGSMALTARGQSVVELLEYQGASLEEADQRNL